jgi:hypothetical protein
VTRDFAVIYQLSAVTTCDQIPVIWSDNRMDWRSDALLIQYAVPGTGQSHFPGMGLRLGAGPARISGSGGHYCGLGLGPDDSGRHDESSSCGTAEVNFRGLGWSWRVAYSAPLRHLPVGVTFELAGHMSRGTTDACPAGTSCTSDELKLASRVNKGASVVVLGFGIETL